MVSPIYALFFCVFLVSVAHGAFLGTAPPKAGVDRCPTTRAMHPLQLTHPPSFPDTRPRSRDGVWHFVPALAGAGGHTEPDAVGECRHRDRDGKQGAGQPGRGRTEPALAKPQHGTRTVMVTPTVLLPAVRSVHARPMCGPGHGVLAAGHVMVACVDIKPWSYVLTHTHTRVLSVACYLVHAVLC